MSERVFVVSEWLAKKNHEKDLWDKFKQLLSLTKQQEKGCLRAHVTRQISHPGSPGKSKYTIILLQEYISIEAFDIHCESDHVKDFVKKYIDNPETGIVEDYQCRLFSEE